MKTQSAANGTFMFDGEDGVCLDIVDSRGLHERQSEPGPSLRIFVRSNSGRRYGASEYSFFSLLPVSSGGNTVMS